MKKVLRNLKIGPKLLIAFGIIVVLYIVTVVSAAVGIHNMSDKFQQFYDEEFQNSKAILQISETVQGTGRGLLLTATEYLNESDMSRIEEVKSNLHYVDEGFEILNNGYLKDDPRVQELNTVFESLRPYRMEIVELLENGERNEAMQMYLDNYEPYANQVRSLLKDLSITAVQDANSRLEQGHNLYTTTLKLIFTVAVLVLLFATVIWLLITRSITIPIKAIQKTTNEISDGNLDTKLEYESGNELGELSDNLRSTVVSLKEYVSEVEKVLTSLGKGNLNYQTDVLFKGDFVALGNAMKEIAYLLRTSMQQISNSAEQVAGGAEQVSNGSQLLAQGASEQAGAIEQLASNINDISDRIKNNAENALQSSEMAKTVGMTIENSNEQMQYLLRIIKETQQNSREITGIVKEIEDIAFQTNILALNASVEAARAGDAGKGFSVVANEVRRLASRSTDAAKLTAELVEKNAATVEQGIHSVDLTAEYLEKSVDGAKKVVTMSDRISDTTLTQANAIAQIRSSIEQITDIVQGNSATSEESAAASEELSAQARILKDLVEQFEL